MTAFSEWKSRNKFFSRKKKTYSEYMSALESRIGCAELIESFMYQIQLLFIQFSTWFNIFMLYPASLLSISLSNENEWMNEIWLSYAGIISWFNL